MTRTDDAAPRRAPRRDALRNDRRVLDAARAVFAEHGPSAGMEEIAARAGVGVGTIYRRFSGKEALLDAIAALFVAELDEAADAAIADEDVERGLTGFLEFVAVFDAEKNRYAASLVDRVADAADTSGTEAKLARLTARAVEAGVLADDVSVADIRVLLLAIRGVVLDATEESWRRFLRVHLDGLRPR